MFQSAPANYGGRIERRMAGLPDLAGFNPRPPITAGELFIVLLSGDAMLVSIRARQLRRANCQLAVQRPGRYAVSIRARQLRRANWERAQSWVKLYEFQSAPANYGGRIA